MIASRQARCLAIFILETGVSAKRQGVWLLIADRIDGRGGKPMTNSGQREVCPKREVALDFPSNLCGRGLQWPRSEV